MTSVLVLDTGYGVAFYGWPLSVSITNKRRAVMRKGQNKKVKNVGQVSCLGLLALMLALVNPVSSAGLAFAEEMSEGEGVVDEDIEVYASTDSTVNIAFLPTAASGTVTPVNSAGDKAKVDVKATVRVQNSGGYSVYVGSSSSQLKSGINTIDSVESATTYANLPVNSWGYAFLKNGVTSTDSTIYNAMPATLRSEALDANANTNITDETRTYTLSFAANIGADKPAGTYTNSVTMSVVSSPLVVAEEFAYDFGGITDMQAMTTAICDAAPTGGVKQLKDTRDGKYYWIGKMKDGKCWMTQNLDLDLSESKNERTLPLTPNDSDVRDIWTPMNGGAGEAYTANVVNGSTIFNSTDGENSWSLGDYSIMNPTSSTSCGYPLESAKACVGSGTADRFRYYATPTTANGDKSAHYILGNHYQWNAATAGTGGTITEGQAESSICPRGWKLPSGASTDAATVSDFEGLVSAYEINTDVAKLVSAPLYFVKGGTVWPFINSLFRDAGADGLYWSSFGVSSSVARTLNFGATHGLKPSAGDGRNFGFSVRCVAR